MKNIPPPLLDEVFPETVEFVMVHVLPDPVVANPPPSIAVLFNIVALVIVPSTPARNIPPPYARFPLPILYPSTVFPFASILDIDTSEQYTKKPPPLKVA